MNSSLALYENAKSAIAEYKSVDEVKDFRDKAVAVEAYAKQANDYELERNAAVARIRAERRCGELLLQTEKAKGGNVAGVNQYANKEEVAVPKENHNQNPTLAQLGLTKKQSSSFQALAKVPEKEFEEAVGMQGAKPSTTHIVRKQKEKEAPQAPVKEQRRMPADSLWLWGRLVDLERDKFFERTLESMKNDMTPAMLNDVERVIPKLKQWLK